MDILLSKVTQQAMNYAIRSGITITSTYAIRQCTRLLKTVNGNEREELAALQQRLEAKIRIISPAIDMIELIAARGNTSLESAVTLTKTLRWDIQSLGVRIATAASNEELIQRSSSRAKSSDQALLELKMITIDIKRLLDKIEDAVPLINLAITTSGASLTTSLPATVSPSRLLQASTFLTAGDTQFALSHGDSVQVGPVFTLSLYMLFSGHAFRGHGEDDFRATTWKEVIHKARVKLLRVPLDRIYEFPLLNGTPARSDPDLKDSKHFQSKSFLRDSRAVERTQEFAYQILIIEDLDDERLHTFDDEKMQPGHYEGVELAGIRDIVPIHEISKIFYADTGKILNIGTEGEPNNPVLLLKRDPNAIPPRRMMEQHGHDEFSDEEPFLTSNNDSVQRNSDEQSQVDAQLFRESPAPQVPSGEHSSYFKQNPPLRLGSDLDPEWMAFEVYTEAEDSDSEVESSDAEVISGPPLQSRAGSIDPTLTAAFSQLDVESSSRHNTPNAEDAQIVLSPQKTAHMVNDSKTRLPTAPNLRTSLSLLEMLIRLTALQQFQQSSHLAISDELLNFFLAESSTVGAGGDAELRQRVRRNARRRVGFDPYDESPIKRRGEEYLSHMRERGASPAANYGQHDYDADDPNFAYQSRPHEDSGARYLKSPGSSVHSHRHSLPLHSPSSPSPAFDSPMERLPSADIPIRSREHIPNQKKVSPSPLLRRATAPNTRMQMMSPRASAADRIGVVGKGPPTAPPSSSSPHRLSSLKAAENKPTTPKREQRPEPPLPETPPES